MGLSLTHSRLVKEKKKEKGGGGEGGKRQEDELGVAFLKVVV